MRHAVELLAKSDAKGLSSPAPRAIYRGADITEFTGIFAGSEESIVAWLVEANGVFNAIEDLPFPTVCASVVSPSEAVRAGNCSRLPRGSAEAVVGFPEVKLGIIPGLVELSARLIGADNANVWISSGTHVKADQAFKEGALDAIVERGKLEAAAEDLVLQCGGQAGLSGPELSLSLGPIE